ncbi:MAG: AsmA-like C-terminal domain-containing protein [Magnetococcales bacterium]|nr:AsmA-like C-terminal domain-containing protein [Magnetococcales bacterium]
MNQSAPQSSTAADPAPVRHLFWSGVVGLRMVVRVLLYGLLTLGLGTMLWLSFFLVDLGARGWGLESWLSRLTGLGLHAEHLYLFLDGHRLMLSGQDVLLRRGSGEEFLANRQFVARFTPLAGLYDGYFFEDLTIDGLRLTLDRSPGGELRLGPWDLARWAAGRGSAPDGPLLPLPFKSLVLTDSQVTLRPAGGAGETVTLEEVFLIRFADGAGNLRIRLAAAGVEGVLEGRLRRGDAQETLLDLAGRDLSPDQLAAFVPALGPWTGLGLRTFLTLESRLGPGRLTGKLAAEIRHPQGRIPVTGQGRYTRNGLWGFEARVDDLQLQHFRKQLGDVPPLDGLTTPLALAARGRSAPGGALSIDWTLAAGRGELAWPALFRWPFQLVSAQAAGRVLRSAGGQWQLGVERFGLDTGKGTAEGRLTLTGLEAGATPHLDLTAKARNVSTAMANHYYPVTIMPPELVEWLDNSLKNGRVREATATIRGPAHLIPFDNSPTAIRNGWTFRIDGDVEGIDIQYYPGLAPVSNMRTRVLFDRLAMSATVQRGQLGDSVREVRGQVRIPNLLVNPTVVVEATAGGTDLAALWRELIAHPTLGWDAAVGLEGTRISGSGSGTLRLNLPIWQVRKSTYAAGIDFQQADLQLPFASPRFTDLEGRLELNERLLTVALNRGMAPDPGLTLQSGSLEASDYGSPQQARFKLRLQNLVDSNTLSRWLAPLLPPGVAAPLATPVTLTLERDPGSPRFLFQGQLDAGAWDFPARWGWKKTARDPGPVQIAGHLDPERRALVFETLDARLGNLSLAGSGVLELGGPGNGERLRLGLKRLGLGQSRGMLDLDGTLPASGTGRWRVDLMAEQLDLRPLLRELDRPAASVSDPKVPRPWPWLDLQVGADQLVLANGERGRGGDLLLELRPNGLTFRHLEYSQDPGIVHRLDEGRMHWKDRRRWGPYAGRFHGTTGDLGRLLNGLDRHGGMRGGAGVLDLRLEGHQPRGEDLLPNLSGFGRIQAHAGLIHRFHILSTLLGLLSVSDLPNLLVGDRPDLAGKGFYYETLAGRFTLRDGRLWTRALALSGPSMKLLVSGETDLARERLDLLVGLQPLESLDRLVNKVPLLGKLVSGSRETLVETLFRVSGTWDEPKVRLKPMDSLAPGIVRDLIDLPGRLLELGRGDPSRRRATPTPEPVRRPEP